MTKPTEYLRDSNLRVVYDEYGVVSKFINESGQVVLDVGGVLVDAPVNTVAPAMTPASGVGGDTLFSCTTGTWLHTPRSYTYQWYDDTSAISNATAATYQTVAGDATKALTCKVVATNAGGSSAAVASNAVTLAGVPTNSVAPAATASSNHVAGTETITCTTGTWANTPTSYTYQWQKGGVDIGAATTNAYSTVAGDAGSAITCNVIAHNGAGASTLQASNGITPAGVPANSVAPAITPASGVAGTVLFTSTTGMWTNSATSYTYQWQKDGSDIAAATATTYQTVLGDSTHAITCNVIAHNTACASSLQASNGVTPS